MRKLFAAIAALVFFCPVGAGAANPAWMLIRRTGDAAGFPIVKGNKIGQQGQENVAWYAQSLRGLVYGKNWWDIGNGPAYGDILLR